MSDQHYYKQDANVARRYTITGRLTLTSPTTLSNGDADGLTDIAIRRDLASGQPVLPGTSLAGALRDHLWQHLPIGSQDWNRDLVNQLFGENNEDERYSQQSWLFIEDAYGEEAGIELRDGVSIDRATRTAEDKKKFDVELLAAGTTFDLRFELWEPAGSNDQHRLLSHALEGLQNGAIMLGGRKRRGYGECKVENWQVHRYDMSNKKDILRWLEKDETHPQPGTTLADMLEISGRPDLLEADACHLEATFDITTSLLIRATSDNSKDPDMMHLRNHAGRPVLSGTSLAGALRGRATRILKTLRTDAETDIFINNLFGREMSDERKVKPRASRLWVREVEIETAVADKVQSRVKIDRFTGGSYPGALFDQQPIFGGQVTLDLTIQKPSEADVGLLLLLLKDLWTGDLPLGGEASVGRGRLHGRKAILSWRGETWKIEINGKGLKIAGDPNTLEKTVQALRTDPIVEVKDE
jgi:CRISPR/Cas system CSM-associated protein Csm3 (group 7 of RAMP superfamily)